MCSCCNVQFEEKKYTYTSTTACTYFFFSKVVYEELEFNEQNGRFIYNLYTFRQVNKQIFVGLNNIHTKPN